MSRLKSVLALVYFILAATSTYALPSQETSVSRTHLMRDIEASTLVVAAGLEFFGENVEYTGDMMFGYLGYAPFRWLEAGIAAHILSFGLYPSLDGKIDLMEFFADNNRWSCLLMGGIGGLPKDTDYPLFYHGGAAANVRMTPWLQLYAGAGGDSVARALAVQMGAYLDPLTWFGASANFKLVIGSEGVEPMASAALFVIGRYQHRPEP